MRIPTIVRMHNRGCLALAMMMMLVVIPMGAVAAKTGRTLRLGFLGSTNLPNSNTQQGGAPALFAARLAVQQINAQSDLLPNTTLELINNNTNSDPGTGNFMAFDQIINKGVVGIIGEHTDMHSKHSRPESASSRRAAAAHLIAPCESSAESTRELLSPLDCCYVCCRRVQFRRVSDGGIPFSILPNSASELRIHQSATLQHKQLQAIPRARIPRSF